MLNSCFKMNKNVIYELDHKILQRILHKSNVENGTLSTNVNLCCKKILITCVHLQMQKCHSKNEKEKPVTLFHFRKGIWAAGELRWDGDFL